MRRLVAILAFLALGAGSVFGVPAASAASDSYSDSSGSVSFHPFTLVRDGGCVPDAEHLGQGNCDPINLIFPGKTWQQVRDALQARGWKVGLGSTQWLHFADSTFYQQDVQLITQDRGGTQYHIRLWQVRGETSTLTLGAVHHERRDGSTHIIDRDWDKAEAYVAGQFCGGTCEKASLTNQATIQGNDGEWRGWLNDAQATVIQ